MTEMPRQRKASPAGERAERPESMSEKVNQKGRQKMEQASNQFLGEEKISVLMRRYSIPCIISLLVGALYNIVVTVVDLADTLE